MHFVSIAQAHQIEDVKGLAQFLHDNGIILWFNYVRFQDILSLQRLLLDQGQLNSIIVVNHKWLSRMVKLMLNYTKPYKGMVARS